MYNTFSIHASTGATGSAKTIISHNIYAPEGRRTLFPTKLSVYINKQADIDGTFSVVEEHTVDQIVGGRLYLYHRPIVSSAGVITDITASDGVIISNNTNAKQAYIEFSTNPVGNFTITYLATSDCLNVWMFNNLQDDMMEVQKILGPVNQTGWTSIRHTAFTLLNHPNDGVSNLYSQAQYLPHLNADLRISSTEDTSLYLTRGSGHNVQVGSRFDVTKIEGSGIYLAGDVDSTNPVSAIKTNIHLGTNTGDKIFYKGSLSGEGQMTVGGVLHTNFSGYNAAISGYVYTGAMIRVHGDAVVLGNLHVVGPITVVHSTGVTSTVLGDFSVRDELFVYGITHLIGPTETNDITVNKDLSLAGNLIALNTAGAGNNGHSVLDNLDASEVALSYKWVTKKRLNNYVVSAPKYTSHSAPKRVDILPNQLLSGQNVVGDDFLYQGILNAAVSNSGAHPSILQLLCTGNPMYIVSGFYTGNLGGASGIFSLGLMDPGSLWIDIPSISYSAPIYGFTVEELTGAGNAAIGRLNVFTPAQPLQSTAGNPSYLLYAPGCRTYKYIVETAGAPSNPTIEIQATTTDPLVVAFEDEVRLLTSNASLSLTTALTYSVSGLPAATPTGCVYIVASKNASTDPELAPTFLARATHLTMPGETLVGEVTAELTGTALWAIREITSYRPGGYYDSAWIPILSGTANTVGRTTPQFGASTQALYFNHNLGPSNSNLNIDFKLYLGAYGANTGHNWPNQYHAFARSLFAQDIRRGAGLSGAFKVIDLTNRGTSSTAANDASLFYVDGKVAGVQINADALLATQSGVTGFNYMRLVATRLE